jgi:arsenate reductase
LNSRARQSAIMLQLLALPLDRMSNAGLQTALIEISQN